MVLGGNGVGVERRVAILFFQFVGPPASTLLDLTGLLAVSRNS